MTSLTGLTALIQGEVGVKRDGLYGPVTASAVLAVLRARHGDQVAEPVITATSDKFEFDARSEAVLATLDAKAQPMFREFLALAKGTAASLGCEYVFISGNRSWAEQDALYAQGRTAPGRIVTNARGGSSNHNFMIAGDAGVFLGKIYLDGGTAGQKARASRVHRACAEHATACGLTWGGGWRPMVDEPHYEVETTLTLAQKRKLFEEKGTVL